MAGLSIAYQLARLGFPPLLIEANHLFSGTSGACAGRAQIFDSHPGSYLDIVLSGIDYLRSLGEELEYDLEWREPGHLALIQDAQEWGELAQRVNELRQRGIHAEMVDETGLRSLEPLLKQGCPGAALSAEGHLNPFRLYQGLAQAANRLGAQWITHAPMTGFAIQRGKVTAVLTSQRCFSPQVVILACGAWTGGLLSKINYSLPMQFTQAEALITEPLPVGHIKHHVGMANFYSAVHGEHRKVAFGAGQHANGTLFVSNAIQPVTNSEVGLQLARRSSAWGMPALAHALQNLFPALSSTRVMRTWSAASPFLPDYQPVIGWASLDQAAPSNLYLAAGFHLAIPTITALARQIAVEITSAQPSPGLDLFRPDRWQVSSEECAN